MVTSPPFALIELGAWFALPDLDSGGDQHFVGDAQTLAARSTADVGFIDLDVLARPAADPVEPRRYAICSDVATALAAP